MIIAVYGSARKAGNTDILMDSFLEPLTGKTEIHKYYLRDMNLRSCIACGGCHTTGVCVFDDDIWDIYKKIESADGLVIASPIYFASVTANTKAFIDRAQPFWSRKYLLDRRNTVAVKKSFFICVGAVNTEKYFLNAKLIMQTYLRNLDIPYSGDLFYSGVDEAGEIRQKAGAVDSAYKAGEAFGFLGNP